MNHSTSVRATSPRRPRSFISPVINPLPKPKIVPVWALFGGRPSLALDKSLSEKPAEAAPLPPDTGVGAPFCSYSDRH